MEFTAAEAKKLPHDARHSNSRPSPDDANAADPYRVAVSVELQCLKSGPERILELTPEEMVSTERQMEIGKIKWKALFDCERGLPPKAATDEFRCGRCGK
nr:transcription elongation factor TFIIS-like [Tanacetum cinerariifolium]